MKFDELFKVINFCKTIEKEGTDPFDFDVGRSLETLKRYLSDFKSFNDLILDAEAISEISKVIELQERWIRDRSSSFYIDPLLIEIKIMLLEPHQLANAFFKSWHPIVSMDRITKKRLEDGMDYWNALSPLGEREEEFPPPSPPEISKIEELIDLKIVSRSEFNESIKEVLNDLKERGRVRYDDFVYEGKFEDAIMRAYLTSYLVSEGEAKLDVDPLKEEIVISPIEETPRGDARSIPVSIDYQDWLRWKKNRRSRKK